MTSSGNRFNVFLEIVPTGEITTKTEKTFLVFSSVAYFLNAAASIATTLTWSNFADQKYCYQWTTHKEKYLQQFTEGSGVCPWFIHNSCATAAGLGLGRTQWSPCMWGRWRRRRPRYSNLRRQNSVSWLPCHTQWFTVVYRTIGYHLDTATTENSRPSHAHD